MLKPISDFFPELRKYAEQIDNDFLLCYTSDSGGIYRIEPLNPHSSEILKGYVMCLYDNGFIDFNQKLVFLSEITGFCEAYYEIVENIRLSED